MNAFAGVGAGLVRRLAPGVLVVSLLGTTACSGLTQWALGMTGGILKDGISAIENEPDIEMIRWGLPGNLKTLEIVLASSPYDQNLLFMAAEGYVAYTFLIVEDDTDLADAAGDTARVKELKARASLLYTRGQEYAARMLVRPGRTLQDVEVALGGNDEQRTDRLLGELSKADVPALFWYTYAKVGRINQDMSNPERIGEMPRVERLLAKAVELDPGYFHGLPLLLSGAVYSARPAMFGGDLPRAKDYFERAIQASAGRFLLTRFTYARYYALQAQDRALYCDLLTQVINAPADILPDQKMMNGVSQRWARRWIDRAPTLFEDGQGCAAAAPATNDSKEGDDDLL